MKTVLVAEDNELLATLWRCALCAESLDVMVAHDGEEVVRMARECRPDLILMDIMMPRIDGLEACRQIASNHVDPPPVIFVSCLARPTDMAEASRLCAVDFLVKGKFTMRQLVDRVSAALSGGLRLQAAS